jgi:uncharacterized repeat protein (TIGR03803 family)
MPIPRNELAVRGRQDGKRAATNRITLLEIACILFAFCVSTAIASPAQMLTALHSFTGYPSDGAGLDSALSRGSDGNYYGTTSAGGDNCSPYGCGTVFKITPDGTETIIYSFCSQLNCADGEGPYGALVQAPDGNFYGTTNSGADGGGTFFKITPSGTLTTLYSFCSQHNCADGRSPNGVVLATDGNFYGVTSGGGSNNNCTLGCGTIFKITPGGTLTTLYVFCSENNNCPDGYNAWGLIQGRDGNFYGATGHGGASGNDCGGLGCGTIFKMTPGGTLTTLYSFCPLGNCRLEAPDGQIPNGKLLQANDGNFYGTTTEGGANQVGFCAEFGCGTIFKITPNGDLTTLYSFCSQNNCVDGWNPSAAPVQAADGNLYGVTYAGGTSRYCDYGCGTIFKITPSGTLTTLYSFCSSNGCPDGLLPNAALVPAPGGNFYGTTDGDGGSNYGTAFRFTALHTCAVCPSVE